MKSSNIRVVTLLAFILCVFIVSAAIIGAINSFSPVPYWDMWGGYVEFYSKVAGGDYSAWWAQHNEHRVVLSKLFFWSDIHWFGGMSYSLIAINYLLVSATCVVFIKFLEATFSALPNKQLQGFFVFFVVGWLFSWCQHENLSWGFQSQFFMAQLLPLCAFFFMYKMSVTLNKSLQYFSLACFFGVLSVGTMANGVIALPLMLGYGVFCRIGMRRNSILFALCVVCIGFYFYGYNWPTGHGSLSDAVKSNPLGIAHYIFLYVGSPFYSILPALNPSIKAGVVTLAGLFFVVLVAGVAYFNFRSARKNHLHLCLLFFIMYIGGTALGTAGGRLVLGVDQALSSRYTTPALMAWAALLVIVLPVIVRWAETRKIILVAFLVLSVAVLVGQYGAFKSQSNENFERLIAALSLELGVNDKNQIMHVYPSSEWAISTAKYPSEKNLSIFGAEPIRDVKEKIGSVNTLSDGTQCAGSLETLPIAGEERYAAVNGWIFDRESESVPTAVLIVDQKNTVVGYALTGGERKGDAQLSNSIAFNSGFKGYILKESLGAKLTVISKESACAFSATPPPISYSFHAVKLAADATTLMASDVIQGAQWTGSDSWHTKLDGLTILGSWLQSDADTGSIVLRVKRGDKLLYRSGPTGGRQLLEFNDKPGTVSVLPVATEWTALEFTDKKFPDSFNITITDNGDGWGEWSAIALKTEHN